MRVAVASVAAALAVGAAAGCGGGDATPDGPKVKPGGPAVASQEAARRLLAEQIKGDCDCTGAARAKERIADGRATRRTQPVILGG